MAAMKRILVTGATGKQGGALLRALTSSPTQTFEIVALTRNVDSPSAQRLRQQPSVKLLKGDLDDVPAIFRQAETPFYGVFSVQTPLKPKKEEAQGIALAENAAKNGVKHFVYTSADRGGPEKSENDPTDVPHFISKFNIEKRLKAVAAETNGGMQWTIIRPVAFMDNLTPDFFGKVFTTALRFNNAKMQLVSTESVGILAAEAFKAPAEFASKSISLATDSLSYEEASAIFKKNFDRDLPTTYDFVGRLILLLAWDQLGVMFKRIREKGFGADPAEFIHKYPGMQNFEQWLQQSSKFTR